MDSTVTFGEWLRQQRDLRRLTREEFARRVGCSVSALRKIEYGERAAGKAAGHLPRVPGVAGGVVFEAQGLRVPENNFIQGSAQDTSAELFLQRARRAHVGFNVTPENYPAIVRTCQLVEGSPLGIELAAAWVLIKASMRNDNPGTAFSTIPRKSNRDHAFCDPLW